jgi:tetratricopeptide (TPR) repeat protein
VNKSSSVRSSLNNAPAAAPPAGTPSPASPDLLLMESSLFWDKYKLPIVAAIALLVVALGASEFYELNQDKKIQAAGAELGSAKTVADYRRIADNYPGTMAGADAMLLLGRQQFDAKDYAAAAATWRSFADKYPQHSLAPVALTGAGTALESLGRNDEARSMYQRAGTSYMNSFAASLARLDEAALLKADHKPEEARRVYENIMASDAGSDAAREAAEELRFLRIMPSAPGSALLPGAVETPAPVVPAAPAASPAPAASGNPPQVAAPAAPAPLPAASPLPR